MSFSLRDDQHSTQGKLESSFANAQAMTEKKDEDVNDLISSLSNESLDISDLTQDVGQKKLNDEFKITSGISFENNQSFPSSSSVTDISFARGNECTDDTNSCDDNSIDEKQDLLNDSDDNYDDHGKIDDLFGDYDEPINRQFCSKDIALAISLLKSRHSLTNSCITNMCRLLKLLRVPNTPNDFRHVRSLICEPFQTTINGKSYTCCPSCHKISSATNHCTTTSACPSKEKFLVNPTTNYVLHLEPQIRSIIERHRLIRPNIDPNRITDTTDSLFYRDLLKREKNGFISLLLNSDGAVVKSISRSIWVTSFVINELPRTVRFRRENLVIGMMSVGSMKPNKEEMQLFLQKLTEELHYLEKNGLQYSPVDRSRFVEQNTKVYLITATCDMPATSLLINHTETTGYYGCTHCTVIGMKSKRVRMDAC